MRVDDRLIHGQVVVGWARPLGIRRIVLVDDAVRASEWEQQIYRVGVPSDVAVEFASVAEAVAALPTWAQAAEAVLILVGDVETLFRMCTQAPNLVRRVNLGGLHHSDGRSRRADYVYLSANEEALLRQLAGSGVEVTAQALPSSKPLTLEDLG